ncbi:ENHANCER OF AG-4 protein 2-like [Forsythia ovata]|uniref:ENHANCER OF AG-4 protein 2-like n=1 Tax=Forsythia ovata TaxID=205694 RepID=A0ABD1W7K9_9LAMI
MAPGRKRGAKGVKTMSKLGLGDLVLAKVKGHPAWPAKISRAEDWERAPDPKKYFVQFFGTSEIAFIAPADIQVFTSEAKDKVSARCQGKTVKVFSQAVKEICEEFEELQRKKSSGIRNDTNKQILESEPPSVDQVADTALEVNLKDGMDFEESNSRMEIKGLGNQSSGLDPCSQRQSEADCQDIKLNTSDDVNHSLSPVTSSKQRNKLFSDGTNLVKESGSTSSLCRHSFHKEGGSRDNKLVKRHHNGIQNELTNGDKPKLAVASQRKPEGANVMLRGSAVSAACNNSVYHVDLSFENSEDEMKRKFASGGNMESSTDNLRSGLDVGSVKAENKLLKDKKYSEAADDFRMNIEVNCEEQEKVEFSLGKMRAQHGCEKQMFQSNEVSYPFERPKSADIADNATVIKAQTSRKNDSKSPNVLDVMDNTEAKRTQGANDENGPFGVQTANEPNASVDEDDLRPTKRHQRALQFENRLGSSGARKNDLLQHDKVRSPVKQLPKKRRAVRLCDEDDDDGELPKTPIHGGFANKVSVLPPVSDSTRRSFLHSKIYVQDQLGMSTSSATAQQGMAKGREISAARVSSSPTQLDSEKLSARVAKPVLVSPKRSPQSIAGNKPLAELQNKHFSKAPGNISQKKAAAGSNRGPVAASDRLNSYINKPTDERNKPTSSGEKRKNTPKSDSRINDSVLMGNQIGSIASLGDRPDVVKDDKASFPIDSKVSETVMSMKHLIAAAAQARKRQAHFQFFYGNPLPLLVPDADIPGRSPSLEPATQVFESRSVPQLDVQVLRPHSSLSSSSSDVRKSSSTNQHENEEFEDRIVNSGKRTAGGSLSGGTEAAVARDAFEGMIETLSRTKESIGRATRLAIDCAKYGIANEVVELLIQKLENEPSFHRRVDLFFLVDSITQCSHTQKGIAGASYIPTVQEALPRLIGAAAPPGSGAHENRRQCHKVLRLWLERKILPESVLRHYMDEIGISNDDASAGLSLRRPSRAERSIDDPIREMEGMLVDEYGSNAMFQLPGFLSSHMFEEEEEEEDYIRTNLCMEVADTSPSQRPSSIGDPETYTVTPSDRRHCTLEDVDGELEMEDVSGHQKDERQFLSNGVFDSSSVEQISDRFLESASNNSIELLLRHEGSPPLPLESPPATPPLPNSPPPPPPPHSLSPSPPPPPPPPAPLSQQHLYLHQPVDSLPTLLPPPSFPPHPGLMSQHFPPLASSISTSSPAAAYQHPPFPHEIGAIPTGNQFAQMAANTPHGAHIDASVRCETLAQQSPCFPPAGVSNAREHSGYNLSRPLDYGPGDAYIYPQSSQHRQPFLPSSASFAQRPLCPDPPPPPQHPHSHYTYPKPSAQEHQYPTYSLPKLSDAPRRFTGDEQWWMQSNGLNADHPRSGWMAGGGSCSGPPFAHEGYFGQPPERPPTSNVGFLSSTPMTLPAATPISGGLFVQKS